MIRPMPNVTGLFATQKIYLAKLCFVLIKEIKRMIQKRELNSATRNVMFIDILMENVCS